MPKYVKSELKKRAQLKYGNISKAFSERQFILESRNFQGQYDIFLSHSYLDADIIKVLKEDLENEGLKVYVDWIDDAQLSRSRVTKETANLIKFRMKNCKSLIYAFSENSPNSKWMPWELGFFDGYRGLVAVLPITEGVSTESFNGVEFVGIYPYITKTPNKSGVDKIWVNRDAEKYVLIERWINEQNSKNIIYG